MSGALHPAVWVQSRARFWCPVPQNTNVLAKMTHERRQLWVMMTSFVATSHLSKHAPAAPTPPSTSSQQPQRPYASSHCPGTSRTHGHTGRHRSAWKTQENETHTARKGIPGRRWQTSKPRRDRRQGRGTHGWTIVPDAPRTLLLTQAGSRSRQSEVTSCLSQEILTKLPCNPCVYFLQHRGNNNCPRPLWGDQ